MTRDLRDMFARAPREHDDPPAPAAAGGSPPAPVPRVPCMPREVRVAAERAKAHGAEVRAARSLEYGDELLIHAPAPAAVGALARAGFARDRAYPHSWLWTPQALLGGREAKGNARRGRGDGAAGEGASGATLAN
jgi:hypothetical protein